MRKVIVTMIMALLGLAYPAMAAAIDFEPLDYSLRAKEFRPINQVDISLHKLTSEDMAMVEGTTATITCDGETVVEAAMEFGYYTSSFINSEFVFPYFRAVFDEPLILPKGKNYTFTVPAGVLYSLSDPSKRSPEYSYNFEVPSNLEYTFNSMNDAERIEKTDCFTFHWSTETERVGESAGLLYQDGELVGEYLLDVSWDWDMGYASMRLSDSYLNPVYFEKDVPFKVVIPQGSVCAIGRPDMINEEIVYEFIGDYEPVEPVPTLYATWSDLDSTPAAGGYIPNGLIAHGAKVGFEREVILGANPLVCLIAYRNDQWVVELSAVPTLEKEDEYWVLSADFQDRHVPYSKRGFMVMAAPGSVVTLDGVPNSVLDFGIDFSGVENVKVEQGAGQADIYDLQGRKVSRMQPGHVYIQGGKTILAR